MILISLFGTLGGIWYDGALMGLTQENVNELLNIVGQQMTASGMAFPDGYDEQMHALISNLLKYCRFHLAFCLLETVGVGLMLGRNERIGFHIYAASQIGIGWLSFLAYGGNAIIPIASCLIMIALYYKFTHIKAAE